MREEERGDDKVLFHVNWGSKNRGTATAVAMLIML